MSPSHVTDFSDVQIESIMLREGEDGSVMADRFPHRIAVDFGLVDPPWGGDVIYKDGERIIVEPDNGRAAYRIVGSGPYYWVCEREQ